MRIYSNLDLTGNTVSNLTANSLIIGQQNNQVTNGAIKWVNGSDSEHPGHFEYYDLLATPGTGWTILSTGSNTTTNQYTADGIFKLAKGSNATSPTGTWPQEIHVDANLSSPNNATSITLNTTSAGDITVATNNTGSPSFTLPIASNIISSAIKTGTFTISSTSGVTVPYTVVINHGLGTQFLDFSLYKKDDGFDSVKNVWTSIICDYYIDPSSTYNLHLYLTSSSVSNVIGDYMFIIIGSSKAPTLTVSNITIEGTSSSGS